MGTEAATPEPGMNPEAVHAVGSSMDSTPRGAPPAAPQPVLRRRFSRPSRPSLFFVVSLALHAAVVAAGITGGSRYSRREGAEAHEAAILFVAAPVAPPTDSVQPTEAEPERPVERPELEEPNPVALSEEATPEPMPLSDSEQLASLPSSHAVPAKDIGEVLGDPKARLNPSREVPGLAIGLTRAPTVSDCCGEPQPEPEGAVSPEKYAYPVVLRMVRAEFPKRLRRLGEEGSVLLEMTVGADGLVKNVVVIESSGSTGIDDSAVDAAWGWLFRPATLNGQAVPSLARHRYTFRLITTRG